MAIEIPEGFTPWAGGDNPAPGKMVKVVYGDGAQSIVSKSEDFESLGTPRTHNYWRHDRGGKYNIVAYLTL